MYILTMDFTHNHLKTLCPYVSMGKKTDAHIVKLRILLVALTIVELAVSLYTNVVHPNTISASFLIVIPIITLLSAVLFPDYMAYAIIAVIILFDFGITSVYNSLGKDPNWQLIGYSFLLFAGLSYLFLLKKNAKRKGHAVILNYKIFGSRLWLASSILVGFVIALYQAISVGFPPCSAEAFPNILTLQYIAAHFSFAYLTSWEFLVLLPQELFLVPLGVSIIMCVGFWKLDNKRAWLVIPALMLVWVFWIWLFGGFVQTSHLCGMPRNTPSFSPI